MCAKHSICIFYFSLDKSIVMKNLEVAITHSQRKQKTYELFGSAENHGRALIHRCMHFLIFVGSGNVTSPSNNEHGS